MVVFSINYRKIVKVSGVKLSGVYRRIVIQQAGVCLFAYFLNKLFLPLFGSIISLFAAGVITVIIFLVTFYVMFLQKEQLAQENREVVANINNSF